MAWPNPLRLKAYAQFFFPNGQGKKIMFGPGIRTTRSEQTSLCEFGIDLRDQLACRQKSIMAGIAKLTASPTEVELPTEIPDTVGPAADLFLRVMRSKMAKDSFRVVPSTIRGFVAFIGKETPSAEIDAKAWAKWKRWLRKAVSKGNLAKGTARVTYGRAREFVYWLISNGKTKGFPELKQAGSKAVPDHPLS